MHNPLKQKLVDLHGCLCRIFTLGKFYCLEFALSQLLRIEFFAALIKYQLWRYRNRHKSIVEYRSITQITEL